MRFRIGDGSLYSEDAATRRAYPGSRFPVEAYYVFAKQIVPRWTTTDDAILAAYTELVDKVGPCIIVAHSQAGQFVFKVAQARPDKVKAVVAVEPAQVGFSDKLSSLKDVPSLFLYGDFIEIDARWPKMKKLGLDFADNINKMVATLRLLSCVPQNR